MMTKCKVAVAAVAIFSTMCIGVIAQSTNPIARATTNSSSSGTSNPRSGQREHQADAASTTASFGSIAATADAYKSALDAHALEDALKLVDKDGAFKGKVAKIYEPRGLAIVEFDENYRSALTAIVWASNYSKFPVLTNLVGKDVLVTGKFIKYRTAAEIVLDKPDQIKVIKQ